MNTTPNITDNLTLALKHYEQMKFLFSSYGEIKDGREYISQSSSPANSSLVYYLRPLIVYSNMVLLMFLLHQVQTVKSLIEKRQSKTHPATSVFDFSCPKLDILHVVKDISACNKIELKLFHTQHYNQVH